MGLGKNTEMSPERVLIDAYLRVSDKVAREDLTCEGMCTYRRNRPPHGRWQEARR